MTREELEKEAEEKAIKVYGVGNDWSVCACKYGYLAGAEPRERLITELKAQIEKMKNCKNCANYMISGKCPCLFRTGWCKNWELAK